MAQTEAELLDNPVAGRPTLILRSPDFHSITEVVAGPVERPAPIGWWLYFFPSLTQFGRMCATLAKEHGGAALSAGELYRYLAEGVWYTTALLPDAGVWWSAVDQSKALATLTYSGATVSIEFRFGETGDVTSIYASGRPAKVGDAFAR